MKQGLLRLLGIVILVAAQLSRGAIVQAQDTAAQASTVETLAAMEAAQDPDTIAEDMAIIVVALTAEELSEVAGTWKNHLRVHLEKTMRVNLRVERAGHEATGDREILASLTARTAELLDVYEVVLLSWQSKGGDESNISSHQKYVNSVRMEILRELDLLTVMKLVLRWLVSWQGGLSILLYLIGFILSVWAMFFVARFVTRLARKGLGKVENISDLLSSFLLKVVYWSTFVFGLAMVLVSFGFNITPAFAVLGGVSFVLGFAMQETLGNFASGLLLLVHRPFDAGDYISAAGYVGYVDRMNIVSTKIRMADAQVVTIPNSKVWGGVITNFSAVELRRVDLVFGIGYKDDAALAIQELQKIVDQHPKCLSEPAADIFVGELGESSVNIFCRPWVKPEDYWNVSWDLTGKVKESFDAAGISIPFPQRDVHVFNEQAKV